MVQLLVGRLGIWSLLLCVVPIIGWFIVENSLAHDSVQGNRIYLMNVIWIDESF